MVNLKHTEKQGIEFLLSLKPKDMKLILVNEKRESDYLRSILSWMKRKSIQSTLLVLVEEGKKNKTCILKSTAQFTSVQKRGLQRQKRNTNKLKNV